ncbi:hypothetical protein HAV15_006384 [Penicillium sp. str. |nr:hypothetical protein HAV15_006384 [Penicillium sp. str. \
MSDDNTRRHWHGNPGDRHQHLNVWMNGGAKSPRTPIPPPPQTEPSKPKAPHRTPPTLAERRRSSAGSSGGLFSNLNTQKRESTNADMATRRASWNEQAAKGGMFSKWWEGYTRGSGSK